MTTFDGFGTPAQLGSDLNQDGGVGDDGGAGQGTNFWYFYSDIIVGPDGAPTFAWVEAKTITGGDPSHDMTFFGPYVASWDGSAWNLVGDPSETVVEFKPPVIGGAATKPTMTDGERFAPSRPQLAYDGTNLFLAYAVCEAASPGGHQWWPFRLQVKYWDGATWTSIDDVAGATWNSYAYGSLSGSPWQGGFSAISLYAGLGDGNVYVSWGESGSTSPNDFTQPFGCYWHVRSYQTDGTIVVDALLVDITDGMGITGTQPSVLPSYDGLVGVTVEAAPAFHRFASDGSGTLYLAFHGVPDPTGAISGQSDFNLYDPVADVLHAIDATGTGFTAISEPASNPTDSITYFYVAAIGGGTSLSLEQTPVDASNAMTIIDGDATPEPFPNGPLTGVLADSANTANVWVVANQDNSGTSTSLEAYLYHRSCPDGDAGSATITGWLASGSTVRFKYPSTMIDSDGGLIYVGGMMGDGGIRVFTIPIIRDAHFCGTPPDVTTGDATDTLCESATFSGTVDPQSDDEVDWWFEWGDDGESFPNSSPGGTATGFDPVDETEMVTDGSLTTGTHYFRMVVEKDGTAFYGDAVEFTETCPSSGNATVNCEFSV